MFILSSVFSTLELLSGNHENENSELKYFKNIKEKFSKKYLVNDQTIYYE